MTTDDHTHPSPAHKAGCPVCNPDKTVPELNDAYRASKEQGPLWTPTVTVERLLRQTRLSTADQITMDRKQLEGLLFDVLRCRNEHSASLCPCGAFEMDGQILHSASCTRAAPETPAGHHMILRDGHGWVTRGDGVQYTAMSNEYVAEIERLRSLLGSHRQTEPVAWMYSRRYGSGLSFVRPKDYTDEEGNLVQPVPLYERPAEKTSGDSTRLDWVLRNVSGAEWRRLGIEYSANMGRDDLDKRIALDVPDEPLCDHGIPVHSPSACPSCHSSSPRSGDA